MALIGPFISGGGGGGGPFSEDSGFELFAEGISFAPFFYPDRVVVGKEHNLARDGSPCGGEDVDNIGSKNKEIHVTGIIRQHEKHALEAIIDYSEPLELISMSWSGEVVVEDGEFEGPIGVDAHTGEFHWQYTINLVSTGEDEPNKIPDAGIIKQASGD